MVRRPRNQNINCVEGVLCGEDIRSFYIIPYLGARVVDSTGNSAGTRREDSCINQGGWAWVTVQLVVSDLHWPPGKNDLSHSLALCHNLPAKASCPAQ